MNDTMSDTSRSSRNPSWQGTASRASTRQQVVATRRAKIVSAVVAILLLVGAIAAWLLWPDPVPRPHTLAIWVCDYPDRRIPINPWAEQDRKTWLTLPLKDTNAFPSQQRNLLVQELRKLEQFPHLDEPVIVYLDGFAVTDPDGKVFLLPNDASLDNPGTWLALDDVLKYLRLCPARHKLLLLDTFQPFSEPSSGILMNDVAQQLEPALKAAVAEDPRLQILSACSPGQISHVSADLGHSVFAFFVLRGLHGEADGQNPEHKRDSRVSLLELVEFVSGHVDRWAWINRRARQTPVLYGSRSEFVLAGMESENPEPIAPAPLPVEYPDWLRSKWRLRDRWWADESFRAAPLAYRQLEAALLRAERQWRGGVAREAIEKDLADRIERLDQRRQEALKQIAWPEPDTSLAATVAIKGVTPPDLSAGDLLDQLKDLTELYARVKQPKADEADKTRLPKDIEAFRKKFEDRPFDLAWTVFAALAGELNPRPEQVRLSIELLGKRPMPYAETRFVQKLMNELKPETAKDWPAESVHLVLQLVAEAARTQAAHPAALPWLREPIGKAGRLRSEGEKLLFDRETGARDKVRPVLAEALRAYQAINQQLEVIQTAQRSRDEAQVELPSFPPYLENDATLEKAWSDALQTALALQEVLTLPANAEKTLTEKILSERLGKMGELSETWRSDRKKLRQPLEPERLKRIINQSNRPTPADWWEMSALLELPWPTVKERTALWTAWRGLAGRLQKDTLDSALPSLETERAEAQERSRGLLRARCSVMLLKLALATAEDNEPKLSPEDLARLEETLVEATRQPGKAETWATLARQLRQSWNPYRSTFLRGP
jgi:hypothetical protein